MKKRLQINSGILEFLILIFLALTMMLYLNGCSAEALKLAREKAAPENAAYWRIDRVESAVKQENGDISVCVGLSGPDEDAKPELNTLTLPLSILSGDTDALKKLELRPGKRVFDSTIHYWYPYWYPIEKTRRGCKTADADTSSSTSVLTVQNISVNHKNRNQLYTLLDNLNKDQPLKERVFEVRFAFAEREAEKETDTANSEIRDNGADDYGDVLLIYWPARIGQQEIQPIAITGVYEDNSTYLYYLLVPVAFVGDVAVITAVIALRISLESMRY